MKLFLITLLACFSVVSATEATVVFVTGEVRKQCLVDEAETGYWINLDGQRYWYKKDQVKSVSYTQNSTLTEKQLADIAAADRLRQSNMRQESEKRARVEQERLSATKASVAEMARQDQSQALAIADERRRADNVAAQNAGEREILAATREVIQAEKRERAAAAAALAEQDRLNRNGVNERTIDRPVVIAKRPLIVVSLIGGTIVAEDGTFLGTINSNEFDVKSISFKFGKYGSQFSATSVFNQFGAYGSPFSHTSCANRFASSPPRLYNSNGIFVGYLTNNAVKSPTIELAALVAVLNSR